MRKMKEIPGNPPNKNRQFGKRKIFVFWVFTVLFSAAVVSVFYVGYVAQRSRPLFSYARSNQRGWTDGIYRRDLELGFITTPNVQGAEILGVGPDVPVRHDKDGFRIPVADGPGDKSPEAHPTMLTLGCSFTYGATNPAEETYPYLVGKYLHGTTKNAGVCSYGLSQMIILAQRLLPVHKPDYLIVQYSPWLTERALTPFAPTYFGKAPTPFIYRSDRGLALHSPVFEGMAMNVPMGKYRNSPKTLSNFISFLWNVGVPLVAHDDFYMARYKISTWAGRNPASMNTSAFREYVSKNQHEVEQFAYEEISKVARENHAKVVTVVIGEGYPVPFAGIFPEDFLVVDAQAALLKPLVDRSLESYQREYGHWRGDPPVLIDGFHPNAKGHRIIAQEIASKINESLSELHTSSR